MWARSLVTLGMNFLLNFEEMKLSGWDRRGSLILKSIDKTDNLTSKKPQNASWKSQTCLWPFSQIRKMFPLENWNTENLFHVVSESEIESQLAVEFLSIFCQIIYFSHPEIKYWKLVSWKMKCRKVFKASLSLFKRFKVLFKGKKVHSKRIVAWQVFP